MKGIIFMQRTIGVKDIQAITTEILSLINIAADNKKIEYYLVGGSALGAMRHGGPIPWDYDVDIALLLCNLDAFCDEIRTVLDGTKYFITKPGDLSDPNNVTLFPRVGLRGSNIRQLHVDVFPLINAPQEMDEAKKYYDDLAALRDRYGKKVVANTTNGGLLKRAIKKIVVKLAYAGIDKDEVFNEYNSLRLKYRDCKSDCFVAPYGGVNGYKDILKKEIFGTPRYVKYANLELPVPEKVEAYLEQLYGDWRKFPEQSSIDKQLQYKVKIEDKEIVL